MQMTLLGRADGEPGAITQTDILGAGSVVKERLITDGRVEATGGVVRECRKP